MCIAAELRAVDLSSSHQFDEEIGAASSENGFFIPKMEFSVRTRCRHAGLPKEISQKQRIRRRKVMAKQQDIQLASEPIPSDPTEEIVKAFDRFPIVALGETHGLQEEADFIAQLIRHPGF